MAIAQIKAQSFIITYSVIFAINGAVHVIRTYNSACQGWDTGTRGKTWAVVKTAVASVMMRMVARGQGNTQLNPVSKPPMTF